MTKPSEDAASPAAEIEIRPMTIEDLPAVYRLGERVFTLDRWPNLYRTWDEFEVIGCYEGDPDCCFVAYRKESLLGFLLGALLQKGGTDRKYGYLIWIAVAPRAAGTGVGRRLFDVFRRKIVDHGAQMILVDTEAKNEGALAFFRSLGFADPVNHVYLSLRLTDDVEEDARILRRRARRKPR